MILDGKIDGFLKGSIETIGKVPVINELNVSENGIYTAPSDIDGYNPVIVNVPKTTLSKLTVTENGTYTAPAGTGYDEVAVDVPFPSNAYLLKEVEGLPKDIATFSDGANLPMLSLKVGIEPIQEGSGDPSPTNIRPISGHTEANVVVSPTTDAEDGTTYTIDLDGTRYGGTLDVVSGVLTVDRVNVDLGTLSWYKDTTTRPVDSATIHAFYASVNNPKTYDTTVVSNVICSHYKTDTSRNVDYGGYDQVKDAIIGGADVNSRLWVYDSRYNDYSTSDFKSAMSGVTAVYELATPQTIQLTPTEVKSLLGSNNVWADTGTINNIEYFAK